MQNHSVALLDQQLPRHQAEAGRRPRDKYARHLSLQFSSPLRADERQTIISDNSASSWRQSDVREASTDYHRALRRSGGSTWPVTRALRPSSLKPSPNLKRSVQIKLRIIREREPPAIKLSLAVDQQKRSADGGREHTAQSA